MNRLRTRIATISGVLRQVVGLRGKLRILAAKLRPADPDRGGTGGVIEVELRGLGPVWIRPRTTDESLIYAHLAEGQHRPPAAAAGWEMKQIVELGTNIGIGLGDLAVRYPLARLLGVEADSANAGLARRNLARFGDRIELVELAVWSAPGTLRLSGDLPGLIAPGEGGRLESTAAALTVDELLARHLPEGPIDYMHLDVVGCEPELLRADSKWPARVRSLKVELYDDGRGFETEECLRVLRALGFEAETGASANGRFAVGIRPG